MPAVDYRFALTDRLRRFREWVGSRRPRSFRAVMFAVLAVGLALIIASDYLPGRYHFATRDTLDLKILFAILIMVSLELLVLGLLLLRFTRAAYDNNNLLLVITFLLLFFAGLSRVLVIPPLSPYLIPTAALGMMTAMIINGRTGLLLVLIASLNIGLMTDFHLEFTLVALITGAFSLYIVTRLSQRSQLLFASAMVSVVAGAAIFASELFREVPLVDAFRESAWSVMNGVLSLFLTLSLLMILEMVFNLTTPLRLLELANPSQPLLRRLMQVAPGTYNHSILMGNLAEAAAEAIGADPLLARVGAYYHDIGKVVRPEYFVENQLHVQNPHDRLNPKLSKLAITAHVRDGEDLARQYNLPEPVIDIIKQHHGTSVLTYFYYKAKDSTQTEVEEEDYRYEEEKPHSREAAIIMLADSVEAATKAMKNPTVKKLQGLIHEVFKQKMDDGQLDCSDLTLGDLHKIQVVFETGLRGLVGHRIVYPRAARENGAPRVSAESPHPAVPPESDGSAPREAPRGFPEPEAPEELTESEELEQPEGLEEPDEPADGNGDGPLAGFGSPLQTDPFRGPRPRSRTVHRADARRLPGAAPPRTGHGRRKDSDGKA